MAGLSEKAASRSQDSKRGSPESTNKTNKKTDNEAAGGREWLTKRIIPRDVSEGEARRGARGRGTKWPEIRDAV
jgi:hypothetical protein